MKQGSPSLLRTLGVVLVAGVWTAVLFPFTLLSVLLTLDGAISIWMARRLWSTAFFWAGGTRIEVFGQENVDPRRPTIYLANHQSTGDIPSMFVALPVNLRFVAKSQLRWVPLIGWYLWAAGHVFIDRSNKRRAFASLDAAAQKIRSGTSIIMFPEGTRSSDGRVGPFKKGPFVLALKAGVAICPVTVEGTAQTMPKNSWRITPGTVKVKVGKPIDASRYSESERDELMRRVRNAIIDQSLELGGPGGNRDEAIAAAGQEGAADSELPGTMAAT